MHRLSDAQASLECALVLKKYSAKTWWLLGWALEEQEKIDAAHHAYAQATNYSWCLSVRRYGVGVWFAQQGLWARAVRAYTDQYRFQQGISARRRSQWWIYIAQAHEQQLDWAQACHAYMQAWQLCPHSITIAERLAWVQAQAGHWMQAESTCQEALRTPIPYWPSPTRRRLHRLLAQCLYQQNQLPPAIEQFALAYRKVLWRHPYLLQLWLRINTRAHDRAYLQLALPFIKQAQQAWMIGDWSCAAKNLEKSVQRCPMHNPYLFIAWGHALAWSGDLQTACHAFFISNLYRWPLNKIQQGYIRKKALRQVMEYTEYLETLPVHSNVVLYESYAGVSISCNPYAIYQAVVDAPEFAGWTHVWVLNDLSRIPDDCAGRSNVIFVARDSQLYQRYLATAGWLINNSTFPSYFIRREAQRYLNTWHGTPLKTLGKDIRGNFMEHKNTARNLLHATHVLSPNEHTSWVLMQRYDIDGLYQGQLAQTGYPRNDLIINATAEQKAQFRQKLGLHDADSKPLVLYAPTWRGILGHPEVDSQQLIADLQHLRQQDCHIVFRGHYFAEQALAQAGLDNVHIAPQAIDTSELLAITDVLITDYSSIFFDYLPTGRPILFYTYDLEQYQHKRGLYFGMEEMPGPHCSSVQELATVLASVLEQTTQQRWQPDGCYRAAQRKFSPNEDGQATQRAVEFFFQKNSETAINPKQDKRKTLLFFVGSFMPMGITTAAINLISALDPAQYRIVVAIDPSAVGSQPERIERLGRLPQHVHIIGRVGRQVCSPQERSVIDEFHRRDTLSLGQWALYAQAFEREFRRIFGNWQPDNIINYDGYARFWAGLLAYGASAQVQRIVYLHNDMYSEWQMKYPHFAGMFALYPRYDRFVSVAQAISQANRANLAQRFDLNAEKFVHADNMPDFDGVRAKAQEPLDEELSEWLANVPPGQVFASIGRLSPEKNHSLLLQAFATLVQAYPQARLVILGDGPLRPALEAQIQQLNLGHTVLLPGLRANPFPLLQRCNCFVLPSLHEGQPMVLLEAMALEKPIIASNIAGVRELLQPGYGCLVELSPAALHQALRQQIENKNIPLKKMNLLEYKKNVLDQFEKILLLNNYCNVLH